MTSDDSRSTEFNPTRALADVDGASSSMVESTDAPRGFALTFVGYIATVFAVINVVPWSAIYVLGAFAVPLFLWYYLAMRRRPKRRPLVKRSLAYMGCILLFGGVLYFSGDWVPGSWGEVAAKWLVVFVLSLASIALARKAEMRHRLKEANERSV